MGQGLGKVTQVLVCDGIHLLAGGCGLDLNVDLAAVAVEDRGGAQPLQKGTLRRLGVRPDLQFDDPGARRGCTEA